MSTVIHTGLPLLIILMMAVVGLELTVADLRRVLHYPLHVAVALIGQIILLPAIATALILILKPDPLIAGGLILAAAAPQAISSNFFCLLARADIALSVTLTAVSSALAVISTPLIAGLGFRLLLAQSSGFELPAGAVAEQVVYGLLLPVIFGMLVRHYAPGFVKRNRTRFQWLSVFALVSMLTLLILEEAETIWFYLLPTVTIALVFMIAAAGLGFGMAKSFSWNREDVVTMIASFPSRSLSIATLVAINVLQQLEFLSFAVVFFLVQSLLLVPMMMLARPAAAN
ncbi:MAG: bile acid:sodium symporter [Burkholderiales bacterium]